MSEVYYCPKCDLRLYWSQVINQLNTEVKCPQCGSFEIYSEQQIMSGINNILGMGQQNPYGSYDLLGPHPKEEVAIPARRKIRVED